MEGVRCTQADLIAGRREYRRKTDRQEDGPVYNARNQENNNRVRVIEAR